ncbi:hypothetical protein QE441_001035 [Chryseobacterium sp. SORGH_AS909]|uniref:DUF6705 domain-containing protein n=2 Tax=Chryseobacterium group TaxID=2782232 RepID=A0ABU0TLE8_9FLAO|nr:hypothetical protein [Chryseobacterium camelliae]MDQ1101803.1 hypothetical protein [Chryseobacterium sp. SORGH_AS_1048]MDR6085241.1 hypothetical protein [Chryseobacterium sp. SORGH_AS_0909]MDT3408276.1 hypothetical protein [Pseudacidovorax intermedius]
MGLCLMMKIIFLLILFSFALSCKAQQIYSLRPKEIDLPENSYEKDTNNELLDYVGTWNNKIITITFKKITNKYDTTFKHYRDYLIGKFIVKDSNGNILFDNTNLSDDQAKIEGVSFRKYGTKYSLIYIDPDLCHMTGSARISFTDATKTKLEWKYSQDNDWVENECFYHGLPYSQRPEPLPSNIILTRQ